MPYIKTRDATEIYYRSWGNGRPIVFVSAWAIGGEMWEHQMVSLSENGFSCIAYDRRGHGRSDDPGEGFEFDTFANDLQDLLRALRLEDVTLVGCSMGCVDIARYISTVGSKRVRSVAFVSSALPCLLERDNNPQGAPQVALDYTMTALHTDRVQYFASVATKYFAIGSSWPMPDVVSADMIEWAVHQTFNASAKAVIESGREHIAGDFRPDLQKFTIPTLVIHGGSDQNAPLELCGYTTAKEIPNSELKIYEGAPHGLFFTHKERLNADLLEFVRK